MSALKESNKTLKILNLDDPTYLILDQPFYKLLLNTGLKKLSLKFNQLKWEGFNNIIFSFVKNTTLIVLELTGNQICFKDIIYVIDYFKKILVY